MLPAAAYKHIPTLKLLATIPAFHETAAHHMAWVITYHVTAIERAPVDELFENNPAFATICSPKIAVKLMHRVENGETFYTRPDKRACLRFSDEVYYNAGKATALKATATKLAAAKSATLSPDIKCHACNQRGHIARNRNALWTTYSAALPNDDVSKAATIPKAAAKAKSSTPAKAAITAQVATTAKVSPMAKISNTSKASNIVRSTRAKSLTYAAALTTAKKGSLKTTRK